MYYFLFIYVSYLQHHEKHVQTKKRIIRDLNRTIKDKESENSAISVELEELNVTVNERRHIHEVNGNVGIWWSNLDVLKYLCSC